MQADIRTLHKKKLRGSRRRQGGPSVSIIAIADPPVETLHELRREGIPLYHARPLSLG